MRVSLLRFDGCPSRSVLDQWLHQALAVVGCAEVQVERVTDSTPEEARATLFHGSPTVLVEGHDPFADRDLPRGQDESRPVVQSKSASVGA